MVAEMRRRLAAHPGLRPSITSRNPLGGGESGGFPISAALLGPGSRRAGELLAAGAGRQAQKLPSLADPKISLNIANPEIRVALDRAARGRPRRPDGDGRRRAAAHGLGRRRDLDFREGAEQYPVKMRVLESQRRDLAGDRQAHRAVVEGRAGPHRQHRAARARPRPEHAAALQPPVLGQPDGRRRAGPRAGRGLERRAPGARRPQAAARILVPPERADEDSRRDDGQPDDGDRPRRASSSTWCWRRSSRASSSRSSS